MTISSVPEPPRLANLAKARNCLGLNATVLPGLGTFRHGSRLRGACEMAVAILGTLWFCKTLVLAAAEMTAGMDFPSAFRAHGWTFLASAVAVVASWISGVNYGRTVLKGEARPR